MNSNDKGTVLVVDDDSLVLKFMTSLIKEYGYIFLGCTNAKDAIEACVKNTVDVLLTDIMHYLKQNTSAGHWIKGNNQQAA